MWFADLLRLFLLFTVQVHAQSACDYVLSFENVSLSGTSVDDGYLFSGFSQYGYYLDICGFYTGATTDSIYAELSDDSGVYWFVYGTMIWNEEMTRAFVQASYLDEVYSTYLDGTVRYSNGWYKISAKGGTMKAPPTSIYTRKLMGHGAYSTMRWPA